MTETIPSWSKDQHQILRWINQLHLGGEWFELDPCFGKGAFYKPDDIPYPDLCYDLDIERTGVHLPNGEPTVAVNQADATDLNMIGNASVRSAIFDPPFLICSGAGSVIKGRYGCFESIGKLVSMYSAAMGELARVLDVGGVLVVKMQNQISSGKQVENVRIARDFAGNAGFVFLDEFILVRDHVLPLQKNQTQRHARKHHSFFMVFRKQA